MSLFDLGWGSSEDREKERNRRHRRKGKMAEDIVESELWMEGFEVEPVDEGADFHAKKRDLLTGEVIEKKKVEVKSGKSDLTERQKKEKKKSDNYEVRRRDPFFF